MIAEFDLGKLQRARVWIGDCPVVGIASKRVRRRMYRTSALTAQDARAAIELKVPRGAMVMYRLLGGHFKPIARQPHLAVEVECADTAERWAFNSPLVTKPEVARGAFPPSSPRPFLKEWPKHCRLVLDRVRVCCCSIARRVAK